MKFQVALVLFSTIALVLAEPASRSRREVQSWPNSPVNCNDGNNGILQVLPQVANVIDNIVLNMGTIWARSQIIGTGHLVTLSAIITQLDGAVTICLSATVQTDALYAENEQLIANLLGQLAALLDTILGNGYGQSYCCTSGGPTSTLTTNLLTSVASVLTGISRIDNVLCYTLREPYHVALTFIIRACG